MHPKTQANNTTTRANKIRPFHVMDILARAKQLEAEGKSIIHLEVGEPDFSTAEPINAAGIRSLQQNKTKYTAATGLPELRDAISVYYKRKFNLDIDHNRIIVTPGASGALQLALAVLTNPGDSILLSDPGYPCNKNIAYTLGLDVTDVIVDESTDYQLNSKHIEQHWQTNTRLAMVSTPSNPTGTVLSSEQMQSLLQEIEKKSGYLIVDEIYQGLVYDEADETALSITDDVFVINSFSKYFGMTGWRLGWMVVPEVFVDDIDRIAQNLFLSPSTPAQYAALEAFSSEAISICDKRVEAFKQRRDYLLSELPSLGFKVKSQPKGAFYIYADCSQITQDAYKWCGQLLENTGVALTPGIDFGNYRANQHVRFAYTRPLSELEEAVKQIRIYIKN